MTRKRERRILTAKSEQELIRSAEQWFGLPADQLERVDYERSGDVWTAVFFRAEDHANYANMDAAYRLEYTGDGVFLELLPPQGTGAPLNQARLIDDIQRRHLNGLEEKALKVLAAKGYGTARIAPAQDEKPLNEELRITIAPDEMSANAVLLPGDESGAAMTMEAAEAELRAKKVTHGIDQDALGKLLREKHYYRECTVARGTKPQDGEDGSIEFHFSRTHSNAPKVDAKSGRADFRSLNLIERVLEGDLLVSRSLATAGVAGSTVCGRVLTPKFGRECRMPHGQKVNYNKDKTEMYAAVSGRVEYKNETVQVSNIYEITGDVDMTIGNIDFDGAVIVHGNVVSKMEIKATGTVTVYGGIQDAKIEAGGDVTIMNGLQGKGAGSVVTPGTLYAKFIEQGRVRAQAVRADEIIYSEVNCSGDVFVTGKLGCIVGGIVRAYHMVVAQTIGAVSHPRTRIEVGIDPQTTKRYETICKKIEKIHQTINELQKVCNYLLPRTEESAENKEKLRQAFATKVKYMQTVQTLERERDQLQKELEGVNNGMIHVLDTVYPGVLLVMSGASYTVTGTPVRNATFKISGNEITFFPCCYSESSRTRPGGPGGS